jgi:hypothetical protein
MASVTMRTVQATAILDCVHAGFQRAQQGDTASSGDRLRPDRLSIEPRSFPAWTDGPLSEVECAKAADGARLTYGERCSRTRFRFAKNPLFCLGSMIPIIGAMIFIHPEMAICT